MNRKTLGTFGGPNSDSCVFFDSCFLFVQVFSCLSHSVLLFPFHSKSCNFIMKSHSHGDGSGRHHSVIQSISFDKFVFLLYVIKSGINMGYSHKWYLLLILMGECNVFGESKCIVKK